MSDFKISVKIADRTYRLKVRREDEEIVRKAQDAINDDIKQYSEHFSYNDSQDLLAMVALDAKLDTIRSNQNIQFNTDELDQRLDDINEILDEII
ncbi:MAG: cell division protein ZapA [Bacteroidales bacterium]|nr:cell division protein ZapA [Bacteroidales bacterium]